MALSGACVAAFFAGITAGALGWVSAVETRVIGGFADAGAEDALKKFFPIWWPHGRSFMLPLLLSTAVAHVLAFLCRLDWLWLISGGLVFSIGPYTALVMKEDINALMAAPAGGVVHVARRFCRLHHLRFVAAFVALGLDLALLFHDSNAAPMLTTGLGGIIVGAYAFTRFVDVKTVAGLSDLREEATLSLTFALYLPAGKAFMGPAHLVQVLMCGVTFVSTPRNYIWLIAGLAVITLIVYTMTVMGPIKAALVASGGKTALLGHDNDGVIELSRKFNKTNKPRLVLALIPYCLSFASLFFRI